MLVTVSVQADSLFLPAAPLFLLSDTSVHLPIAYIHSSTEDKLGTCFLSDMNPMTEHLFDMHSLAVKMLQCNVMP